MKTVLPLITRDPITGGELLVTRLESPENGLVIEGAFSLGWIARLSTEQLEFVGLLLKNRGNVQKLAADMGVAYNTARNRLDDIVEALGVAVELEPRVTRIEILDRLRAGDIGFDDAMYLLAGHQESSR